MPSVKCGPKKKWIFENVSYSKLIIASGLTPRVPFPAASSLTVYNSQDVEKINQIISGKSVLVLGGGLLGVESAGNLWNLKRKNKIDKMTILLSENEPLANIYGPEIGKDSRIIYIV